MIKSRIFIYFTLAEVLILSAMVVYGQTVRFARGVDEVRQKRELVGRLGLTDFSIWTEARYTRHPSQADFFSPFQDNPAALDHFPAGSVIAPPFDLAGKRP